MLVGMQGQFRKSVLIGEGVCECGSGFEEVFEFGLEEGVGLVVVQDVLGAALQEIKEILALGGLLG